MLDNCLSLWPLADGQIWWVGIMYTGACGNPGDGYINLAEFKVFYDTVDVAALATNNDGDNRVWNSAAYNNGDPDSATDGNATTYWHSGGITGCECLHMHCAYVLLLRRADATRWPGCLAACDAFFRAPSWVLCGKCQVIEVVCSAGAHD
jgi:hypothetical protein